MRPPWSRRCATGFAPGMCGSKAAGTMGSTKIRGVKVADIDG